MSVTVYGASDDLIEVEGDIDEEFTYSLDNEGDVLAFSDGTILRVFYDRDGIWRISPLARGTASLSVEQCAKDDAEGAYSDRATLDGDVRWVVHGDAYAAVPASSGAVA